MDELGRDIADLGFDEETGMLIALLDTLAQPPYAEAVVAAELSDSLAQLKRAATAYEEADLVKAVDDAKPAEYVTLHRARKFIFAASGDLRPDIELFAELEPNEELATKLGVAPEELAGLVESCKTMQSRLDELNESVTKLAKARITRGETQEETDESDEDELSAQLAGETE